ncbi:MAG: flagella basal body P-ring formation protein FlgA [Sphingorhabdus sp.]
MKKKFSSLLLAACILSPAHAQQFEDLQALDAKVAVAVGRDAAKPIDRRLKLARCPEPVTLDTSTTAAVTLRCYPIGWRIRVPVTPPAAAANSGELLVKRGETVEIVIQSDDFEITSSGVAAEDGFSGKRIRVKSSTGSSLITGTVMGQSLVYIQD